MVILNASSCSFSGTEKGQDQHYESEDGQPETVTLANGTVGEVEEFTYLGSVVSNDGGSDQRVEAKTGKAKPTFRAADRLWKSTGSDEA